MSRWIFCARLRDQEVEIDVSILKPEPDVGLMGYGFEDTRITDLEGNELDWELTDEETDQINALVEGALIDMEENAKGWELDSEEGP